MHLKIPVYGILLLNISGDRNEYMYLPNSSLNEKVSLWEGDITRLEVDAIVNSSADDLHHHFADSGVCYAIHAAAGPLLFNECSTLNLGLNNAVVTRGYNLPAKCELFKFLVMYMWSLLWDNLCIILYLDVIHTSGPCDGDGVMLQSCYSKCFELILKHGFRSVVSLVCIWYSLILHVLGI